MYHTGMMQRKARRRPSDAPRRLKARRPLTTDEPRYQMVADDLERRITSGELEVGHRIPGENELALSFKVSRVTVRAALTVLERKGLVVRRAGAGTFVAPPRRLHHDLAVLENLFGQFARQGIRTEKRTLDFGWAKVEDDEQRVLGYTEMMRLKRLWFAHDRPFAITESYLHPDTRGISRSEAERTPAYSMLESLGHHVARADLTVHAERAGRLVARALRVDTGMPVLVLQRTSFSRTGEPLERTTCFARSDAIEFAFSAHDATSPAPSLRPL
jgi:GntR family transcriptional regulator